MPRIFHDQNFRKELLSLALPVIVQEILVFLVNFSNQLIVKAILGPDAFNGTTSANDVFSIFNTLLMSFVFAGAAFSAQFAGKKDITSVRKIFNLSLKISFILALVFMVVSMVFPEQIIAGLTGGTEIIEFGANYLRIFAIAFVFRGLSAMYYYSLKNAKKTKLIAILSISTFVLNVGLTTAFCYVQIGGNPSIGPAIAAVAARGLELLLLIIFTWRMEETKFSLKYFLHTDANLLPGYMKYTVALLASRILWGFGNMLMSKIVINHIAYPEIVDPSGGQTLALITANNTVSTVRSLVNCSTAGITAATSVLIGRELGANKLREANAHSKDVMRFLKLLAAFNIVMSFVYVPIFMINAGANVDPSKLDVFNANFTNFVWMFSGIYALSYLAQVHNATINDALFTGGGDKVAMFMVNGLFMWGIVVPLGLTSFYLQWDPILIFTICTSEELVKCWAVILRYYNKTWVRNIVDSDANKLKNFRFDYQKNKQQVLVTFDYKTINGIKYPVKVDNSVQEPINYTQELLLNRDENKKLMHFADTYFRKNIN
ncbi:MAG: hypothetical protein MJ207_02465 [Bacilli bacterium]|nr:hypothetical protein [Bacilli bacterium]